MEQFYKIYLNIHENYFHIKTIFKILEYYVLMHSSFDEI
jgi:hypothetical protein